MRVMKTGTAAFRCPRCSHTQIEFANQLVDCYSCGTKYTTSVEQTPGYEIVTNNKQMAVLMAAALHEMISRKMISFTHSDTGGELSAVTEAKIFDEHTAAFSIADPSGQRFLIEIRATQTTLSA